MEQDESSKKTYSPTNEVEIEEKEKKEENTKKSMKWFLKKTGNYIVNLRLEPIMAFYTLCTSVAQPFIQNVIIQKSCLETYSMETCNNKANETIEANVQSIAAQYLMNLYLLRLIPAIVISVFVGHWSDIHGRKQVLIVALVGNIVTYVLYVINVIYIEASPIYMVLAAIPAGLCGDYATMMFGMYSIMRDTTSLADLGVKIAIIDGIEQIGYELGPLISSQLYYHLGYVAVFVCSIAFLGAGLLYTGIRIKEPQFAVTGWKTSVRDFLHIKSFFKNLNVLVQKRQGHRRAYIAASMFCCVLFYATYIGYEELIYLYGRLIIGWDVITYSYFTVFVGGLQAIGFMILMPLVVKWFHTSDIGLVLIGSTTGSAWYLCTAFVTTLGEMFGFRCFGVLLCFASVSFRAITLKCVEEDEVGKMTGMYSIAQTLGQILGRIVSTQIYVASIRTFPGTYFVFCAAMLAVITIVFGVVMKNVRSRKDVDI